MKKYIEKLHFITHNISQHSQIEQVEIACQAGAKWIQYRCLTKSDEELLADIKVIGDICDDWGTTLIVTDHIHLKGKGDIQGFHIEDINANFTTLRKVLGDGFTLGGSANTIEGLIRLATEGADYAGFGPFAISTTKPTNLSVQSLESYSKAVTELAALGITMPVIAVGGITLTDVQPLLQTGIYGIAVSAAINQSENMNAAYQYFYDELIR